MLSLPGEGAVKVSKVKGHATQSMVDKGDARHEDLVDNDGADNAANFVVLRQHDGVISARRALIRVRWGIDILTMMELHLCMVAFSRIEVNHDGHGWHCPECHCLG